MSRYILYGAGHDGLTAMRFLGKDNIIFFCDSNRCGDLIEGIPIIGIDDLKEKSHEGIVVLAVSKVEYVIEISKELIKRDIEFVFWKNMARETIRQEGLEYNALNKSLNFEYKKDNEYLVVEDRNEDAGTIGSYFWQDLWAARHIYNKKPVNHFDIGSRVDGFIAHLLAYGQKVTLIDIRPLEVTMDGLKFIQADATNLDNIDDDSIESVSALCSLEHFGLGRYGDPIDPEACFKCFAAIQKKVKHGGYIYISVPIGREHLEFNAHRVFFPKTVIDSFDQMKLVEFSSCYKNEYERNIDIHKYDDWYEYGGERFGLFVFRKM